MLCGRMRVLGIETSCDETAAAIVTDRLEVRANLVYSQIHRHQPYGGVVPEIAARAHVEVLPRLMEEALEQAGMGWGEVDRIAVTRGPGLASSLLVGLAAAKGLAWRLGRPLTAVHHLEAHLSSIYLGLSEPPSALLPAVVLLVSGGHTCLLYTDAPGTYRRLGSTLDDAAGEALDKGAKLLGLGYPGGPALEKAARGGDPQAVRFPRGSMRGARPEDGIAFSYSGLKTALRYHLAANPVEPGTPAFCDVCASYQWAVVDALIAGAERAIKAHPCGTLACAGGVARNALLRSRLDDLASRHGVRLRMADPEFCTDNAAMVAAVAALGLGEPVADPAAVDVRPTWPLGD